MVFRYDNITSTNDFVKMLYQNGTIGHGAVVVAAYQNKGRGQEATQWESEEGMNLLVSILLLPLNIDAGKQILLNITVSLAVFDFVAEQISDVVRIKWPNDIYVGDKKVAGILVENMLQGNMIKQAVVGMGININQEQFFSSKATSLKIVDGRYRDLNVMLSSLLEKLNKRYSDMLQLSPAVLLRQYNDCLYRLNALTRFKIRDTNEVLAAEVLGMDNAGRLKLYVNGKTELFHNKQVEWLI